MSSQGANLYFIVLGPDGSQIQEVPAEYFSNLKGFPSRPQAERYLRITEALRDQNPPSQPRTPERHNNNRYPNSSSHWEESGDNNQRNLPSILRSPSLGGSQDVLNRVVPPQQRTSPHPSGSPASTAPRAIQPIVLSEEQTTILNMVKSRCNVFFTGPAGTGKSVLLRQIIKSLRDELGLSVAMTASTGIAGVNVGGSTLHSWAGIGLGKEKTETLVRRIKRSLKILNWTSTDTLIIDESMYNYLNEHFPLNPYISVSMIDGRLFDKLEEIGRAVRGSELPFGGLQVC
ncbi:hypothetical protein GYMLUDRAFT_332469 [Collybiopsis luxurians FD-317 M1]|nr:hypothetical protein GYMLUDRAFT_332469 [Collybiopsis luxurians FD-317 M1]